MKQRTDTRILEQKKAALKHEALLFGGMCFVLIGLVLFANQGYNPFGEGTSLTGHSIYDGSHNAFGPKVSAELASKIMDMDDLSSDNPSLRVIVRFNDYNKGLRSFEQRYPHYSTKTKILPIIDGIAINATIDDILKLSDEDFISGVFEDRLYNVSRTEEVKRLNAARVWNETFNDIPLDGTGISVAIIDTGIDYTHPEFGCASIGDGCVVEKGSNFIQDYIYYVEYKNVSRQKRETEFSDGDKIQELTLTAGSSKTVYVSIPPTADIDNAEFAITLISSASTNIAVTIGAEQVFSETMSSSSNKEYAYGLDSAIGDELQDCIGSLDECEIPITITSTSASQVMLHDLEIRYTYTSNELVGDPMDDNGHGTHVAGIVHSVAPGASLYAYKVLDDLGFGYDSEIISGIDAAIKDDADVISMSLGSSTIYAGNCDDDPMVVAVHEAMDAKVSVVIASGNSYSDSGLSSPACGSGVISVGAIDINNTVADFSNKGQTLEVVAYGVDVLSTVPGGNYEAYSGTSMATPFVSGLVALYKQAFYLKNDEEALPDNVVYAMESTADDLGLFNRDDSYGYGLPNITKMVDGAAYRTIVSPRFRTLTMDNLADGMNEVKLLLMQQGIPDEFDLTLSWDNLDNGDDTIDLSINGNANSFSTTIYGRLNLTVALTLEDATKAGTYYGSIHVYVKQQNRTITIPLTAEIPLGLSEGYIIFQDAVREGQTLRYPVVITDNITAITVEAEWEHDTSDIDLTMYSPDGSSAIITSEEIQRMMKEDINNSRLNVNFKNRINEERSRRQR